jgi:hypothetical protein
MRRVAAVGLVWATLLFTAGAVGLVGTWALTTAAIAFPAASVLLATALDDGPTPVRDEDLAALEPST